MLLLLATLENDGNPGLRRCKTGRSNSGDLRGFAVAMDRLCHYGPQSGCMGRNLASTLIVESEVGSVIAIYGFFSHKPRCCYNWATNDCEAILQIGSVKSWLMKGGWQEYGSPYVL